MPSPDSAGRAAMPTPASTSGTTPGLGGLPNGRDPQTLEEAAKQFEQVLVRQFVKVMTKDMFSASLAGDEGPGWMQSQRGTQRDMMTDMLSQHLAASEDLPIAEQLMKKWGAPGDAPETPAAPLREPVDPIPAAPSNPSPHLPSSHIDHAA